MFCTGGQGRQVHRRVPAQLDEHPAVGEGQVHAGLEATRWSHWRICWRPTRTLSARRISESESPDTGRPNAPPRSSVVIVVRMGSSLMNHEEMKATMETKPATLKAVSREPA